MLGMGKQLKLGASIDKLAHSYRRISKVEVMVFCKDIRKERVGLVCAFCAGSTIGCRLTMLIFFAVTCHTCDLFFLVVRM